MDDAQKWLSAPNESIHLLICHGFKINPVTTPTKLTQPSKSPAPPARHNGISSSHNVSHSPKLTSPVYANTNNQPPPVPAKPKYRSPNAQFVPINGDNHTPRRQSQNGLEIDESDLSVTESERSFKDKKKFFEAGLKDNGPRPKRMLNNLIFQL